MAGFCKTKREEKKSYKETEDTFFRASFWMSYLEDTLRKVIWY